MKSTSGELSILTFTSADELHIWLENNHAASRGIWIRIFKKNLGIPSVSFEDVLDEGLCFGWSESSRRSYDDISYLQPFTPRNIFGTQSQRNTERVRALIKEGRMTPSGLKALGLEISKNPHLPVSR